MGFSVSHRLMPHRLSGFTFVPKCATLKPNRTGPTGGYTNGMKEIRARVISQEKDLYRICLDDEVKNATVSGRFRYEATVLSDFPTVGDYVVAEWPEDDANAVIQSLFPRKSFLMRKAAGSGKQEQLVAANIDVIFLCMSLNRDYNLRRLERYLSVAFDSGATPVVVLTKKDLCDDVSGKINEVSSMAIGVEVIAVSNREDEFRELLRFIRPGQTVAFLGSSGVGKSTLINKLIGREVLSTGALGHEGKGRHTTTRRELFALEGGAFVIDTPGMRELGMWDHDSGIDTAFSDIEELARHCRFSNCGHRTEPGCAVQAALADGSLTAARWESYNKLKKENEYAADGSLYREAKRAKFKEIAKLNKARNPKR